MTQSLYSYDRYDVDTGEVFKVAGLTHWNGKTVEGTEPSEITFSVNARFAADSGVDAKTFTFKINYDAGATGEGDAFSIPGVLRSNETFDYKVRSLRCSYWGLGRMRARYRRVLSRADCTPIQTGMFMASLCECLHRCRCLQLGYLVWWQ